MKPPEEMKRELVKQWLTKAEQDLTAARILLQANPFVLCIVCFHAQQAAEKALKAYLAWEQIDFPKTHNIGALIMLISGVNKELADGLMPARILSDYAVEGRYPGDLPEVNQEEASEAIKLSESVRDAIYVALRDAVQQI